MYLFCNMNWSLLAFVRSGGGKDKILKFKFYLNLNEMLHTGSGIGSMFLLWWCYFEGVVNVLRQSLATACGVTGAIHGAVSFPDFLSLVYTPLWPSRVSSFSCLLPTAMTFWSCSDHVLTHHELGINSTKVCGLRQKHWTQTNSSPHAWGISQMFCPCHSEFLWL